MASWAEHDFDLEVRADQEVPPAATARAVELARRLATASGRQVRYAAVALGVDDQWRGRRSCQIEIVVDAVGIYVRGFEAGATFGEALDGLDRKLERRLGYARDRVRSRAGVRPGPPRSLLAGPPAHLSILRTSPGELAEGGQLLPAGTRSSSVIGQTTSVSGPAGSSGPVR